MDFREGETAFAEPDGADAHDAALRFIGLVRSDWRDRSSCPKSVREARERGGGNSFVDLLPRFRAGLADLVDGQWIVLLTWLDRARRDLALQRPRHAERPFGTFSLRSPVRPNPIGLHLVKVLQIDHAGGRMAIDAIDVLDETPLLDIKPFIGSVDAPPSGEA